MVVAEFDKYLHDELDLVREAANCSQLRRNFAGRHCSTCPRLWDWCEQNVMVMERLHATPVSQVTRCAKPVSTSRSLHATAWKFSSLRCSRDGFFHADMHPGNIAVRTDAAIEGQYVGMDFGIVGTLTDVDRRYLAENFLAFFRRDYRRVAAHIESGWVPPGTRVDELENAVQQRL